MFYAPLTAKELTGEQVHITYQIVSTILPYQIFLKAIVIYTVGFLLVVCFWPCTGRSLSNKNLSSRLLLPRYC